ncbi:hypothetical protein F4V91_04995 [Neorhizobium galegae]|uniref:Uncharacterized protein n=1 Tax=Neorhizobium galegae TaxID=399 RepID=A0A6A1TPD2_NEOGA|nr:hypothetical protein F4V91_04995 [Neorhizobium galegae]
MFLNWVRLWKQLNKEKSGRCRKGRRDPLADPLEGAEWHGLLWAVPLLSRLTNGNHKRRERRALRPRDYQPVSGWSRSSAGSRDAEIRHRSAC